MTSTVWTLSPSWYYIYLSIENGDGGACKNRDWSLENGNGGAWKMGTVGLGKCGRRSLENRDGGAWKTERAEPGKWDRWSLDLRLSGFFDVILPLQRQ